MDELATDKKVTVSGLKNLYLKREKITVLTAYDHTMARLLDEAGVDVILVGDSLGMVVQGHKTTLPVQIEDLIYHTQCVARGVARAHVMADMPFLSYQVNFDEAVRNAGQLIQAGAESVKLECGEEFAELIWYLNRIGIPVMAHIGLKPQTYHTMGGYKIQGRSKSQAQDLKCQAKVLADAGAFALLLEGIPLEVAREITESVHIPTIGIGSGPFCSGQVLVCYDVLGASPEFKPRYIRQYMDLHAEVTKAVGGFIADVKKCDFPAEKESVHQNLVAVKAQALL